MREDRKFKFHEQAVCIGRAKRILQEGSRLLFHIRSVRAVKRTDRAFLAFVMLIRSEPSPGGERDSAVEAKQQTFSPKINPSRIWESYALADCRTYIFLVASSRTLLGHRSSCMAVTDRKKKRSQKNTTQGFNVVQILHLQVVPSIGPVMKFRNHLDVSTLTHKAIRSPDSDWP